MYKIDARRHVEEMAQVLRTQESPNRCEAVLAILRRWQFDEMLDDASRMEARTLVSEFASRLPTSRSGFSDVQNGAPGGGEPRADHSSVRSD